MQLYFKLMRILGQQRQHERWTRAQLEDHQATSLSRLREYTYARSPFYQRFHKGLFDRQLHELPVLTQATVVENFNDLVTDRTVHLDAVRTHIAGDRAAKKLGGRYWVATTSGDTDIPGVFLFNRDEWAVVLASLGRVREWAGWETSLNHMLHRMPVGVLGSANPWHLSAQMTQSLNTLMAKVMPMQVFDRSRPIDELVQQLNLWHPHMLSGPPSTMRSLAEQQLAGRLRLHPHFITPDSEVLTEETRARIEEAWGQSVFNVYWATAAGNLAAERSDHTGPYLFEDNLIFEVVDEQYRPVPPGAYGERLLITVLFGRTQPLIRYELTDRVRLAATAAGSELPFARIDGFADRAGSGGDGQ